MSEGQEYDNHQVALNTLDIEVLEDTYSHAAGYYSSATPFDWGE